jgi:hypothetical protein
MDTVRVGKLIAALQPGVDTLETSFEARGPSGNVDRRTSVSIVRRTRETIGGEAVLHVRFGGDGQGPSFDFYLDPRTMATRRFEQHTPIDSAVTILTNGCVSGWVHLEKAERRELQCVRYGDRFGGSPLDDFIVALLPLKADFAAALATFGVIRPMPNTANPANTLSFLNEYIPLTSPI